MNSLKIISFNGTFDLSGNVSGVIFYMFIFFSGACTVRLEMPLDMQSALIFHYNLKFYNNDTDNYDGVSLKRFVMQVHNRNKILSRMQSKYFYDMKYFNDLKYFCDMKYFCPVLYFAVVVNHKSFCVSVGC